MKCRCGFKHAGRENDEEVRLKTLPIYASQARDARPDGNALDVEDQFVSNINSEVLRNLAIQRDWNYIAGMIIDPADPFPGRDLFCLDYLLAISRSIFSL